MNEDDSAADSVDGDSSDREQTAGSPSADDLYGALARRPRRRVLSYLLEQPTTSVDELADVLVGWDAATRDRALGPDERRHTLLELVHVHLPHLEDAGLVVYDADTGADVNEVRLRPMDEQAHEVVRVALELEGTPESPETS